MYRALGPWSKVDTDDAQLRINAPEVEGTVVDLNNPTDWLRPAAQVHIGKLLTQCIDIVGDILTPLEDQSPAAALQRIQMQLPEDADMLLKGRVRIVKLGVPCYDSLHP